MNLTVGQGLLLGAAIGLPLGLLIGAFLYSQARSKHQRRLKGPGEVYIGPRGVYQDASYTSWGGGFRMELSGVKLEEGDPAVLRFDVKGHRGSAGEVRVAVPRGLEKEAAELVQRFTSLK